MLTNRSQEESHPMIKAQPSPSVVIRLMYKLLLGNWLVSACRISLIIMMYVFKDTFLAKNPWDYLIFTMIGLVDAISLLGELNTYKVLRKQQQILSSIQNQRLNNINPTLRPRFGVYQSYLSVYETLYNYKYKYNATSSSYSIIRYLHFISSFGIFGSLALKNIGVQQDKSTDSDPNLLKQFVLLAMLLSVYVNSFEVDYFILEKSTGKYQCIQKLGEAVAEQIRRKFIVWRKIVALLYFVALILLITGMGMVASLQDITQFTPIVIVCSIQGGFIITNIVVQMNFVKQVINNPNIIRHPQHSQYICSISHLLYELKGKAPQFHYVLNSGTRILAFCVYMVTFVYFDNLHQQSIGVLLSIPASLGIAQSFKFVYGHKSHINYIQPAQLSIDQRVHMTCSICLTNYVDSSNACELPCSSEHIFHSDCIRDWVKNKKQCPLCRSDLSQFLK